MLLLLQRKVTQVILVQRLRTWQLRGKEMISSSQPGKEEQVAVSDKRHRMHGKRSLETVIISACLQQTTATLIKGPRGAGSTTKGKGTWPWHQAKGLKIQYGLEQRECNRHKFAPQPTGLNSKTQLWSCCSGPQHLKVGPPGSQTRPPNPSFQPQTKKSSNRTFSVSFPVSYPLVTLDQLLFPNPTRASCPCHSPRLAVSAAELRPLLHVPPVPFPVSSSYSLVEPALP